MLEVKSLADSCTIAELVKLWNDGFEGYFVDVKMNSDRFLAKFSAEGLSPELSVVAFDGTRPVGFILNGVRAFAGKTVAWNGGTGVITSARRQGVGQRLLDSTLSLYHHQGVSEARLESIAENQAALRLYENNGYGTADRLLVLQRTEGRTPSFQSKSESPINVQIERVSPAILATLSFYDWKAAWQSQAFAVVDGDGYIAYNDNAQPVGYALSKRTYSPDGTSRGTVLFQCQTEDGLRQDYSDQIIRQLLKVVFDGDQGHALAFNISEGENVLLTQLQNNNFQVVSKQVHMVREMEE